MPPPTATATATATPQPPQLRFEPAELIQGGLVVVSLDSAAVASATLFFNGSAYPMVKDGATWWAALGVGALAQPGLYDVQVEFVESATGLTATLQGSLAIVDHAFPVENITLDPETASLLSPQVVQAELALRAGIFASFTEEKLWSGIFRHPTGAPISSHYGVGRSYNGGPVTDYHKGTDFAAASGEPVLAAARGRVVFAGELTVRGTAVILDHGAGVFSAYHHLSRIDVAEGSLVDAGDQIGAIGSSGLVTGPHLHWEVVIHGVEVDGERLLAAGALSP